MQVETFECHETASEPIEATEEALSIIEELGLDGQASLITEDDNVTKRCPYREITADEHWVYKTLCPDEKSIEEYKASPIPLRVLQVAAHAKQTIPGCRLKVWDRVSAAVPDPVLVAETGEYVYSPDKTFILARWGSELEAFATLLRQAAAMRRDALRSTAKQIVNRVESATDAEIGAARISSNLA